jgi:hypothetical protein
MRKVLKQANWKAPSFKQRLVHCAVVQGFKGLKSPSKYINKVQAENI